MKKTILLLLTFLLLNNAKSQVANESKPLNDYQVTKINYNVFLGIDLIKEFKDFNNELSPYLNLKNNREGMLTPVSFTALKINKNHYLGKYKFINQSVVFYSDYSVQMVTLSNNNSITKNTLKEFKEITGIFTQKYNKPTVNNERNAKWDFPNYTLIVTLNDENLLQILYGKKSTGKPN